MSKIYRASPEEKEKRLIEAQNMILKGMSEYDIRKKFVIQYDLSSKQAQRYYIQAYQRWKPTEEITLESRRLARVEFLKKKISELKNEYKRRPSGLKIELEYLKEISKLEALYPANEIMLSGNSESPIVLKASPFLSEKDEKDYQEYLEKKYNFNKIM